MTPSRGFAPRSKCDGGPGDLLSRSLWSWQEHVDQCAGRRSGNHLALRGDRAADGAGDGSPIWRYCGLRSRVPLGPDLWQGIIFPLERAHVTSSEGGQGCRLPDVDVPQNLGPRLAPEPEIVDPDGPDDGEVRKRLEMFRKQAQLLVKGNQDSNATRLSRGLAARGGWDEAGLEHLRLPEDQERISGIKTALALAKAGKTHRCELTGDPSRFRRDLHEHASGFLAPLIKKLQVLWDSPLLKSGMMLVDLPGVGVCGRCIQAGDTEMD